MNIAKKNAKVTERKLDLARAGTHAEIIELKTEIAALTGTSTTKDVEESAPAYHSWGLGLPRSLSDAYPGLIEA